MVFRFLTVSLLAVAMASTVQAESADSVLALSTDNDLFAPTQTDRDYTAGVAITYSSNSEDFIRNPVSSVSQGLDSVLLPHLGGEVGEPGSAALELGVYGFTPEEIKESAIDRSDRPYSSLVYFSSSQSYQTPGADSGWTTSMTVGVLGLDIFKSGQNAVHKIVGSDRANGWDHQISNGGEPTSGTLRRTTNIWMPANQTNSSK